MVAMVALETLPHQEEAEVDEEVIITTTARCSLEEEEEEDNDEQDSESPPTPTTAILVSPQPRPVWILPILVVSQFLGTALWFAPNAVFSKLTAELHLANDRDISYLTSAVQLGFIIGTFTFALFSIADRLRPTQVFFVCSVLGALSNVAVVWVKVFGGVLFLRGLTGFFLAGIYPVGMKVAADWYPHATLGPALGVLVGALVLGSALPFLLHRIPQSWQALLVETSVGAVVAGLLMGCVIPDGPHRRQATRFQPLVVWHLFDSADFSAACLGYFGHMWEVYALWAYLPLVWKGYLQHVDETKAENHVDLIVFGIIAMGALGCAMGGWLSIRYGSALVATSCLVASGCCCAISPALYLLPYPVTLIWYLVWGMAVAADSPQFSSLVAQTAPAHVKGSALTLSTCIGFALTIGSIQLLGAVPLAPQYLFVLLSPGPVCGVWWMRKLVRKERQQILSMSTTSSHRSSRLDRSCQDVELQKEPHLPKMVQKETTMSDNSC